ncbi:hypothetical protein ON010_g17648 [Phytophthora cinnamomi]|nr:hypothetical protein ON010_g17648 [Phytophthora cinnamomi]
MTQTRPPTPESDVSRDFLAAHCSVTSTVPGQVPGAVAPAGPVPARDAGARRARDQARHGREGADPSRRRPGRGLPVPGVPQPAAAQALPARVPPVPRSRAAVPVAPAEPTGHGAALPDAVPELGQQRAHGCFGGQGHARAAVQGHGHYAVSGSYCQELASRAAHRGQPHLFCHGLTAGNTVASTPTRLQDASDDDEDDDTFEVVEELEQIVEVLLCGLRDKDTVVRWSAAKGIGRITGRLPYEFADDIVQSVLELFVATEGDGAWHGASLALAELARRGVLLPQRLPDAVECVANALKYDIRKGTYSIGSHVRDAACYACWSFARAYEPSLLLPWLKQVLAPAMLVNCVFDRELNCRRAASAAFQENVGRQGRTNFPNGIDLLTKADYFSVANLRHAFLDVSVFVAKYPEYRYALLEHLIESKIVHWDVQIRSLAASALGKIGALDPPHAMTRIFPRLLASALSPDAEVPVFIDGELQKKVKILPIEVDKRRLFRGRGVSINARRVLCSSD